MPELYGIFRPNGLCPDDMGKFDKMGGIFPAPKLARCEVEKLSWGAIGTISLYKNDSIVSLCPEQPTAKCLWIGVHQKDNERLALPDLIESLRRQDMSFLQAYDPPFAACIWDEHLQAVWLISDPYGLHPLYYACQNGLLSFCTKLLPLLRSGAVDWQYDKEAMFDFFTYEHVTGNRTFADSVKLLPPGTILSFSNGRLHLRSYLRSHETDTFTRQSIHGTSARLYEQLSSSVARAMQSKHRAAITLSGGLDSRAILGCAVEQGVNVHTYTFGTANCRDVVYARELARRCGVSHSEVNIEASYLPRWLEHGIFVTGGMVSCIHYHILSLADILSSEADVVLDGLGGDALTGGHLKWTMVMTRSSECAARTVYRQRATAWATREDHENLFHPDLLGQICYDPAEAVYKNFENLKGAPLWRGCHHFDLSERQRRFIQYGPHLLRSSVDVRTPFYSTGLVNLMTNVPKTHLIEQRAYLHMHSKYLRSLAKVPDSTRNVPVRWPVSLRFGKKVYDYARRRLSRRFGLFASQNQVAPTDYAAWFRTDLREFLKERLLGDRIAFDGIIRRQAIEGLLREHFDGGVDYSVKIGCLLTFHAWRTSLKS